MIADFTALPAALWILSRERPGRASAAGADALSGQPARDAAAASPAVAHQAGRAALLVAAQRVRGREADAQRCGAAGSGSPSAM